MADRISQIVASVLDLSAEQVADDTSPDTVPAWDSLAHMNLVMSLESEFGISLLPEDAMEMLSVRLIRLILAEKIPQEALNSPDSGDYSC
jgi:acyl carrier protein